MGVVVAAIVPCKGLGLLWRHLFQSAQAKGLVWVVRSIIFWAVFHIHCFSEELVPDHAVFFVDNERLQVELFILRHCEVFSLCQSNWLLPDALDSKLILNGLVFLELELVADV